MNSSVAFKCIALSKKGPTKRRNEDALLIDGKVHQGDFCLELEVSRQAGKPLIFAVADGMAGSPHPHAGSRLLLKLLAESFGKSPASPVNLRDRMLELQDTFVARGRKLKCDGTSATLAGVVITGNQVQVFNVGDSRVYGIKDGTVRQLSRDHTELADMIESGEIRPMTVREAPSSFLEPSSFYMADPMHILTQVFQHSIELSEADEILICSDGLVDVLDDEEIASRATSAESLKSLVALARKRKGMDDITVLTLGAGTGQSTQDFGRRSQTT